MLFQVLAGEMTSRGVVISGGIGAGKTAIIEQLLDCSCFGDGKSGLIEGNGSLKIAFFIYTYFTYISCLDNNLKIDFLAEWQQN